MLISKESRVCVWITKDHLSHKKIVSTDFRRTDTESLRLKENFHWNSKTSNARNRSNTKSLTWNVECIYDFYVGFSIREWMADNKVMWLYMKSTHQMNVRSAVDPYTSWKLTFCHFLVRFCSEIVRIQLQNNRNR